MTDAPDTAELLPCEVPLVEQLERIPPGAHLSWEQDGVSYHVPIGDLCQRVAAEIRKLTANPSDSGLVERLFGDAGVFKLAYAGAGASAWREKLDEFGETEKLLRAALAAQPTLPKDESDG